MTAPVPERCRVLEVDPEIGERIDPDEWELARSVCLARRCRVPSGAWDVGALAASEPHLLAFVVASGLICREVSMGRRRMFELLGPGDVVQPPVVAAYPHLGGPVTFTAAAETAVLALGELFIRAAARWPSLLVTIHERLEAQRENLAIQGLILHFPRAEHRVLLQLWHLAGRWGRVTAEGTLVPLSLTHELLGQLVAARRSTVTLAVATLVSEGLVRRPNNSTWLLTPEVEQKIAAIAGEDRSGQAIGELFRVRHHAAVVGDESRALRAQSRQLIHRRRAGNRQG